MKILKDKKRALEEIEKTMKEEKEKKVKKKEFNFRKNGFDCNGNIITFKPIRISELKREFNFSKTGIIK